MTRVIEAGEEELSKEWPPDVSVVDVISDTRR